MSLRRVIFSAIVMASVALGLSAKEKPQVVMTVGDTPVGLERFVYLYEKNREQQHSAISAQDYAPMYALYMMKVLEAKQLGLDTLPEFKKEYEKYKRELLVPYLYDKELENLMVEEVYNRMGTEVNVSHIMVPLGNDSIQREANRQRLDSIRRRVLAGDDFAALARQYSSDRSATANGGNMGYIHANTLPYNFETAAYSTPVGEVSEIIATPFGYHIVKVEAARPSSGEVLVRHILKLTQGKSEEEAAAAKVAIDSIYESVTHGADFAETAMRESEDPGSGGQGGMLPWFGMGRMVPEFEAVAFSLNSGEISEPFATSYGYHIIEKLDSRDMAPLEEVRSRILNMMRREGRIEVPYRTRMLALKEKLGVGEPGDTVLTPQLENEIALAEEAYLMANDVDFRNLLDEYHDGILLFEISNREVWDKSVTDTAGQEAYFEVHKGDYQKESTGEVELKDVRNEVIRDYEKALNSAWEAKLKDKYRVKYNKSLLKKIK